jgi:hypothetical protein
MLSSGALAPDPEPSLGLAGFYQGTNRWGLVSPPASEAATHAALPQKSVIMPHQEIRLHLSHGVDRDTHGN